ncbi:uncharacterized protein LOC133677829 isoform X2 [Populus nigra]|uniref:uncharacterized protein LOC133677829 isoform X2 n=1 Tax=Populus nigra TaxID=3691 RepID=UPI002B26818B|nr:uncharacterized protein LOC133677829 isoform X2 [Populus nigra]
MMADQGGKSLIREYKKGNWTVSETMVLIEAKRMDDERRMKRSDSAEGRSKPTELRWKWVEDYCWKQECLRSQNQCNDKWDNLMRDYKKVRDYERKIAETGERNGGSYWKLEKNERKERNLPSNMLPQIYQELVEVVERRGGQQRMLTAAGGSGSNPNTSYVVERPITDVQPSVLPPLLQHQVSAAPTPALPLPPPCPPPSQQPQAQPPPPIQFPEPFPTILIQVSIQTHQQREGEEAVEVGKEPVVALPVQAPHMKWALPFPKVLLSLQKQFRPVMREKKEDTEIS